MIQADHVQRRFGACGALGFAFLGEHFFHRQVDVGKAGHPRQQAVVLKHHATLRPWPVDFSAVADQAAFAGVQQAGNQVEDGGLATTGVANQRDELTFGNAQIDIGQGLETALLGIEVFADLGQFNEFIHQNSP